MKIYNNKNCNIILKNDYPIKCMNYEDSVSIYIIQYNHSDESKRWTETIIDEHDGKEIMLENSLDGYYTIQEIILPKLSFIKKYLREFDFIGKETIDRLETHPTSKENNNCSFWSKFLKKVRYIQKKQIDDVFFDDVINDDEEHHEEDPPEIIDKVSVYISKEGFIKIEVPEEDRFKDDEGNYGLPCPLEVILSNDTKITIPKYTLEYGDIDEFSSYWIKQITPDSIYNEDINVEYIKIEKVENKLVKSSSFEEFPELSLTLILNNGKIVMFPEEESEILVDENCEYVENIYPNYYDKYSIGYNSPKEEEPDDLDFYFYYNNEIYHHIDQQEELEVVDIETISNVNPEISNIYSEIKDFFSVCNLRKCYIRLCQEIFNSASFDRCFKNKVDSDLRYKRDLVWASLNTIQYMVDCDQLKEAERLLEQLTTCNGLCKEYNNENCGCNKKPLNCGCKND